MPRPDYNWHRASSLAKWWLNSGPNRQWHVRVRPAAPVVELAVRCREIIDPQSKHVITRLRKRGLRRNLGPAIVAALTGFGLFTARDSRVLEIRLGIASLLIRLQ